jgi:hypothetical protein
LKSVEEIEKEIVELISKVDEVQEGQDLTCSCTDCYWNFTQSNNQCVSESLNEFKMTPNSLECNGYWKR